MCYSVFMRYHVLKKVIIGPTLYIPGDFVEVDDLDPRKVHQLVNLRYLGQPAFETSPATPAPAEPAKKGK